MAFTQNTKKLGSFMQIPARCNKLECSKDVGTLDETLRFEWPFREGIESDAELLLVRVFSFEGATRLSALELLADRGDAGDDRDRQDSLHDAFACVTVSQVISTAADLYLLSELWSEDHNDNVISQLKTAAPAERFEKFCTIEMLARDSELSMDLRTNLLVCGLAIDSETGVALYRSTRAWRSRIEKQVDNYSGYPELALWDVACNLAAEDEYENFVKLSEASCFNQTNFVRNVDMLFVADYRHGQGLVCALHRLPVIEDCDSSVLAGSKGVFRNALKQTAQRLNFVEVVAPDRHIGLFMTPCVAQAKQRCYWSPLSADKAALCRALGVVELGQRDSLHDSTLLEAQEMLARETLIVHIHSASGSLLRQLCIIVAEAGRPLLEDSDHMRALVSYLRTVVISTASSGWSVERASLLVLLDADTPDLDAATKLEQTFRHQNFDVLTPSSSNDNYLTARRLHSEMLRHTHNKDTCLKTKEAHRTFVAMLQPIGAIGMPWAAVGDAYPVPDLRSTEELLPNSRWPLEHSMVRLQLHCKDHLVWNTPSGPVV